MSSGRMVRILLIFVGVSFASTGFCQQAAHEIWPELDLFYKFNQNLRLFAMGSANRLTGGDNYTDGELGIHLDIFSNPILKKRKAEGAGKGQYLWFRIGYIYKASTPNAEDKFKDDIIVTEMNTKNYLSRDFLLTVRNRVDWKFEGSNFSLRYRPRLTLEHPFKTEYLTFTGYIYGEYFFDFVTNPQDRLRLCLGTELKVTKNTTCKIYFLHQFQNVAVGGVNAFGITYRVYMGAKKTRHAAPQGEDPHKTVE